MKVENISRLNLWKTRAAETLSKIGRIFLN